MKKLLLAVGLLTFAIPALAQGAPATAQGAPATPWYAGVQLGLAILHNVDASQPGGSATIEYDTGFGFGGVVGFRANPNFRLEGEISYRTADVSSVGGGSASGISLATTGFLVNGYYDFTQAKLAVTPFVGLGVGLIHGTASGLGQSYSDTEFGYQLTLGLAFAVAPQVSLNAAYRYQGSSDFSSNGTTLPYRSSNIMVGLNYLF